MMENYRIFLERIARFHAQEEAWPCEDAVVRFVEQLVQLLFRRSRQRSGTEVEEGLSHIFAGLASCLVPRALMETTVNDILCGFRERLPALYERLLRDAEAIEQGDPAATGREEVMRTYPGFFAIACYRIAHALAEEKVQLIPRMITEYAHGRTGIDIHPGAIIGDRFFIDHGTGVVIGETTIIGNDVKIYQGVTIGALSVKKELAAVKRHPTIGDRTVIYAGATILGGSTEIGHDSVIGGNTWITESLPPFSLAMHTPEITIKQRKEHEATH